MTGRASRRLHETGFAAQKTFFIGVEDRHQRHFGQIQPFAQQVDPDKDIKISQPQVSQNFHALNRIDIRMQVFDFDF